MRDQLHANLEVKPIKDASLINLIYNHSDFAGKLLHDNIKTFYIKHQSVSYLGAYVDGELAGVFMMIDKCRIDVDIHIAILKQYVKHSRALCQLCIDKTFAKGYARITVSATDYARTMVNLALKLGFQLEGRKRAAFLRNGVLYDIYILGMTIGDYNGRYSRRDIRHYSGGCGG